MPRNAAACSNEEAMQISLQNWLLAVQPSCFAFKTLPRVGTIRQSACCWLELSWKSVIDCIGHRIAVYTPTQGSSMGCSGCV